jgi:serine/threonine protein kinase/Tfp pilus assembly protein PilF
MAGKAQEVFENAVDLAGAEREAFLRGACGEDRSLRAEIDGLLRAFERGAGFLDSPTAAVPGSTIATAAAPIRETPGTHIGPYRLLQLIGEGGFGSVFMAEQEKPVSRKVALKIIKLGMDTRAVIARFEAERQALALMDHPNIARVLDAGATETGRPYFVMELCKGESIVEYCDKNSLNIHDRLELFAQVCQAVQHAHTKGIIHRDIKPSNILVSTQDGRPHAKVIDFGIAKATASKLTEKTLFTEHRAFIGTPEYMSPEQAEGSLDIDTRTDVYSLGVLLYELLTGTTPFNSNELRSAAYAEIQRIIREVEPPKPSTRLSHNTDTLASVAAKRHVEPRKLGTIIRGELDWIVMKALEKDRARRYETTNGLAMDVRRYLSGEAVLAAPPSTTYRFRKFVRRHRAQVAAAALVSAALLLGLAGTAWQTKVASDQAAAAKKAEADANTARDAEKTRSDELKQVSDFQTKMLAQVDPTTAGMRLTEDVNRRFAAALEKAKVPETQRAALTNEFRGDWARVNATDAATALIDETILKPAVKAIDEQFKDQPIVDAQLRQALADRYRDLGLFDAAFPLQDSALKTRRRLLGEEHLDTIESIRNLGLLLKAQGKLAESEPSCREALEKYGRVLEEEHPYTLNAIDNLGCLLLAQGKLDQAEPYLREALEKRRRVLGEERADTIMSIFSMGGLLKAQGKLDQAEPYFREALKKSRRTLGEKHANTIASLNGMGFLLQAQGKLDQAELYYREALEKRRRVLGEEHPDTIVSIGNVGNVLLNQGKLAEAEPFLREALEKYRRVLGEEHPATLNAMDIMGGLLLNQGKLDQAEPYFREALATRRRVLGERHPDTLGSINNMGHLLWVEGNFAEAEGYFREALEMGRSVLGEEHPDTLLFINNVGYVLKSQGKLAEAERYLRESLEKSRRVLGEKHPDTISSIANVGLLLQAQGKLAEAEAYLREALETSRSALGEESLATLNSINNLASLLQLEGKLAEAETYYREALEKVRRVLGEEHAATLAAVNNLGALLCAQEKFAEAEPYCREALDKRRRLLGEEHPDTIASISNLGTVLVAQGKLAEAEPYLRDALKKSRRVLGETHPNTLDTANKLGGLLLAQGRPDEALALRREMLSIQRRVLPPGSVELGAQLAAFGFELLNLGTLEAAREAEPLLRESLEIRLKTMPDDWRTPNAQSMLGGAILMTADVDPGLTSEARSARLHEAEPLLLHGYAGLKDNSAVPTPAQAGGDRRREALERIVHLYEVWEKDESGKGFGAKAAAWKGKLDSPPSTPDKK